MSEAVSSASVIDDLADDQAERQHFESILESFRQYRRAAHYNLTHVRRQDFYALPEAHKSVLSQAPFSFLETLAEIDNAIDVNANLAEAIAEAGVQSFDMQQTSVPGEHTSECVATELNIDKARSTLHQLYRDWSAEGKAERDVLHRMVLQDLMSFFDAGDRKARRILVPGAGLARLVFDLCQEGFTVEGNEVSYHQLLTSFYILNKTRHAEQWTLHPWISTFSNHLCRVDQLRKVVIPDVHPGSVSLDCEMTMTCGDFCDVYSDESYADRFDAVVTMFFIDTAPDLFKYAETIRACLRDGGLWINLGPLLWHFEAGKTHNDGSTGPSKIRVGSTDEINLDRQPCFELTNDEIKALVRLHDFVIIHEEDSIGHVGYIQNPRSMLQSLYRPSHWVARKEAATSLQ